MQQTKFNGTTARVLDSAWNVTEIGTRTCLSEMAPDPEGVSEAYRQGERLLKTLKLAKLESFGQEFPYLEAAVKALEGRLHAQYAYIRDSAISEAVR